MYIYSDTQLYNRYVNEQASHAVEDELLSPASLGEIYNAYPDTLYTPNLFIRIALGLLTTVAVLFSAGLFGLLFWSSNTSVITGLVFLSIICYAALELFVRKKNFYNAGVDNMLMIAILVFISGAFFVADFSFDTRMLAAMMMFISGWLCLRFTDAFMAVICYVSFFIFIFLSFIELGSVARIASPFLMMVCAAGTYAIFQRRRANKEFRPYHFCYTAITLCALLSFYISSNYYVVNELSIKMFGSPLTRSSLIAGIFWVFTVTVPILYVGFGILSKDRLLIRTGLLLVAAAVMTVQYYYPFFPVEITMLIAGTLLIAISYALIRYLDRPKHGFVFKVKKAGIVSGEQLESLITTERFGASVQGEAGFKFGGGSGSGAGASGQF